METLSKLLQERDHILDEMARLGPMRKGSVSQYQIVSEGKDGTRKTRGPYLKYTCKKNSKTQGKHLKNQDEADWYRRQIDQYRRFEELKIMNHMDKLHKEDPSAGARRLALYLDCDGFGAFSRKRVRRFMKIMGMEALYPRPRTTIFARGREHFPYLLRNLEISRPNQVWCADITYIPMRRGFLYLFAIMDWHSRKIIAWELSNTLETDFCVETLKRAMRQYGVPEIMNTDQGCQFTDDDWIEALKDRGVSISMDGKGCWRDNVVIERFWRSVKYEDLYLCMYEDGAALRLGIAKYIERYNCRRPHQSLSGQTPEEIYTREEAA